jgi:hypothetical protein
MKFLLYFKNKKPYYNKKENSFKKISQAKFLSKIQLEIIIIISKIKKK